MTDGNPKGDTEKKKRRRREEASDLVGAHFSALSTSPTDWLSGLDRKKLARDCERGESGLVT